MRSQVVSHEEWPRTRPERRAAGPKFTAPYLSPLAVNGFAVAGWLGLAAAPTFALMALFAGVFDGGTADMICGAGQDTWPLGGMMPMYLLMSAFHLPPWLRLVSERRHGPFTQDSEPDERAL
ncbi:MAG: hypothetical protein ACREIP_00205 [Alphaproteobacteria bacterium]